MPVLIKGMEMPKSCDECPFIAEADDYHVCYINGQFIPWEWVDKHSAEQRHPKPSWCPLIELPPHGRLIDADALKEIEFCGLQADKKIIYQMGWNDAIEAIAKNAPTIIEAEGETE